MTAILKGNCKQSLDCLFLKKKTLNMSHIKVKRCNFKGVTLEI